MKKFLQTLPPTSAAANFHSLRVYFQILEWKGSGDEISPLEWGWKKSDGKLMPVLTDLPPAPDELMKMISIFIIHLLQTHNRSVGIKDIKAASQFNIEYLDISTFKDKCLEPY